MPRRLLPLVVGLAGLGLLALACGWWLVPRRGVSQANHDRIQIGWTEAQVKAVLGGEAHGDARAGDDDRVRKSWFQDDAFIWVEFREGRVADKHFGVVPQFGCVRETVWDRLRRRLPF